MPIISEDIFTAAELHDEAIELIYFDGNGNFFFDNDHPNITEIFTVAQVMAMGEAQGVIRTDDEQIDSEITEPAEKRKGRPKKEQ